MFLLSFVLTSPLVFLQEPIPQFVDRAAAADLDVVTYSGSTEKNHILESTGNGVLVLDYDRDGLGCPS